MPSFLEKVCATVGAGDTFPIIESFLGRAGDVLGELKGVLYTNVCRRAGAINGEVGGVYAGNELFCFGRVCGGRCLWVGVFANAEIETVFGGRCMCFEVFTYSEIGIFGYGLVCSGHCL